MSAPDDYSGEMRIPSRIDDPTVEALFAGRPVHPELDPLATVVRALREVSQQPVPPSDELAASMAAGAFPDAAATADAPGGVRRAAAWLWRVTLGRATGLRLAARLGAAGLAVGVVSVGGAGFAGTLPPPAQARFESVVESVSPYRFAERGDEDPPAGGPGETGEPTLPGGPRPVPGGPRTGAPAQPPDPQQTRGSGQHDDTRPGRGDDPPGHSDDDPGPPPAPPGLPADPPQAPPGPPGEAGDPPGRSGDAPGRSGDNPGNRPTQPPGGRP